MKIEIPTTKSVFIVSILYQIIKNFEIFAKMNLLKEKAILSDFRDLTLSAYALQS